MSAAGRDITAKTQNAVWLSCLSSINWRDSKLLCGIVCRLRIHFTFHHLVLSSSTKALVWECHRQTTIRQKCIQSNLQTITHKPPDYWGTFFVFPKPRMTTYSWMSTGKDAVLIICMQLQCFNLATPPYNRCFSSFLIFNSVISSSTAPVHRDGWLPGVWSLGVYV